MMDLISDNLKLEEELENAINSDVEINSKVQNIKNILSRIVATEATIAKFNKLTNNNNKQLNTENNGNNN